MNMDILLFSYSITVSVLFLCVSAAWARVLLLSDMYGTMHSPGFPEPYPKDNEVQWNISIPEGYQIRLYFMHFDIEPSYLCEYDYVKPCMTHRSLTLSVYSESEELAVFCGRENTDTEQVPADDVILSPGNILSVAFRSDFSNEEHYSGFEAHYSAVVKCSDSIYTEVSGLITSADFPKPYPKSSDCLYRIKLEKGFSVTLEFDDTFDIEDHPDVTCPYDHIKIQAGDRVFGPFCGGRSPGRIQTGSNIVSILFHSDNSGENLGWKLTYTSTGSECEAPMLPPNGQFEPLQSKYYFKEHITVTCDPGYLLQKICTIAHSRILNSSRPVQQLKPKQVLLSVEDTSRVPTGRWFGSGALLSPSWVLTAAHVLRRQLRDMSVVPVDPEHVQATLGLTDIRDKSLAINRSIETLILHPEFDPRNYNNDIALVKLSRDVVLTELVKPVCLPPPWVKGQTCTPLPNTLGVVAGWGINMPNSSALDNGITFDLGVVSEVLQYVKLPVVAQEECEASYTSRSASYNITENMFCAGFYEGGRDTCLGDSGGGFVMKDPHSGRWVVQGLVSWGGPEGCGSRHVYGVYTRVANYATWLHKTMNTECWW
ncbi:hypothetical protein QTP86_010966 [Hemibagrus guttatus]|nr:hypothetical protein QTP86_010966 [Hemibagrus guttatus]